MLKKTLPIFLLCLAAIGTAHADLGYCDEGTAGCKKLEVLNDSSITVTSVTFIQQPTGGVCTKDERTYTRNLAPHGENYKIFVDTNCKYTFKFKTSSGCKGDKKAQITPKNFEAGHKTAVLKYDCGSLKAKSR